MTNEIKLKAGILKSFLNSKGLKIKHTEAIEALSMLEANQCYNVFKNHTIKILNFGEGLSFQELEKNNFQVSVVIPIEIESFMNGIDSVNDDASSTITGSEYALNGISYSVYPYFYGENSVAVHVTGYIEEIENLSHMDGYNNPNND